MFSVTKAEPFEVMTSLEWSKSHFAAGIEKWNFYSNILSGLLELSSEFWADFVISKIESWISVFPQEGDLKTRPVIDQRQPNIIKS